MRERNNVIVVDETNGGQGIIADGLMIVTHADSKIRIAEYPGCHGSHIVEIKDVRVIEFALSASAAQLLAQETGVSIERAQNADDSECEVISLPLPLPDPTDQDRG